MSRPGFFRGLEGWAAVVPVLGQARGGAHGVGGGPRGTRRRESAARQGDRTAVLNVARMVASLRCEGPLQQHTITDGPRKRCRGVSCESSHPDRHTEASTCRYKERMPTRDGCQGGGPSRGELERRDAGIRQHISMVAPWMQPSQRLIAAQSPGSKPRQTHHLR